MSSGSEDRGTAALEGVLIVCKERGPSSNRVLQEVRKILGGVKAGHAGTLDPEAEGALLLCLGQGTKLVPFLVGLDKEYSGTMKFGEETDSQDGAGTVTSRAPVEHLTEDLIEAGMASFLGEGLQKPPMYSAVKVNGQRLYRLARRGAVVSREPRRIVVESFALAGWEPPFLDFHVKCSSGTYVRTLCRDLARRCGSAGHMTALTRTAIGPFHLDGAVTVDAIRSAVEETPPALPVIPPAEVLSGLPALRLTAEESLKVRQGQVLRLSADRAGPGVEVGGRIRLLDGEGRLAAVARYGGADEAVELERVFT